MNETTKTIEVPSPEQMRELGTRLAAVLRAGDLVLLHGGLGAGKTTLTQGIGAGLQVAGHVSSPTFIIARSHRPQGAGPGLVHVDAYRLGSLTELDALDLDTSLEDAVTVVEWGEGLAEILASDRIEIRIDRPHGGLDASEFDLSEDAVRVLTLRFIGPRWEGVELP